MSKFHFKGSGQQTRRPKRDAVSLLDEWVQGYYGSYYDILAEGGALDPDGERAYRNLDRVRTLTQLLPNGSADDLVFMSQVAGSSPAEYEPNNSWVRRDIVSQNGVKRVRKPMLFYPTGLLTGEPYPELGEVKFVIPMGADGIPTDVPMLEYTTGLYGMKMLHELGIDPATLETLENASPQIGLPVPTNPGTLIIRCRMQPGEPNVPEIEFFVNGVSMGGPGGIGASGDPVDPAVGLPRSNWILMFAMPCWATQKMFNITRWLDDEQIALLHDVMEKTSEDYQ